MREKIYIALRDMDNSKALTDADPGVKLGIEAAIERYGHYRMSYPDNPCNTCVVQIVCQIKKIYDLSDLNIARPITYDICDKIDFWTEIIKCEEIKEKFLEESKRRVSTDKIDDDRNYQSYLAMSLNNYAKLQKYKKL